MPGSRNLKQPTFGYKYIPAQHDQEPQKGKFKAQVAGSELSFGRKDFQNAILLFEIADPKSKDNDSMVVPNEKSLDQLKVIFPSDEYGFLENITITKTSAGKDETIQIPHLIYRLESHKVVALGRPLESSREEENDWDSVLAIVR